MRTVHKPNIGPFSETSSAGSGSGSRSMLSEYESEWPPLTVGASSLADGEVTQDGPAAEAGMGSLLFKLPPLSVAKSVCCCFCNAAWEERKIVEQTISS